MTSRLYSPPHSYQYRGQTVKGAPLEAATRGHVVLLLSNLIRQNHLVTLQEITNIIIKKNIYNNVDTFMGKPAIYITDHSELSFGCIYIVMASEEKANEAMHILDRIEQPGGGPLHVNVGKSVFDNYTGRYNFEAKIVTVPKSPKQQGVAPPIVSDVHFPSLSISSPIPSPKHASTNSVWERHSVSKQLEELENIESMLVEEIILEIVKIHTSGCGKGAAAKRMCEFLSTNEELYKDVCKRYFNMDSFTIGNVKKHLLYPEDTNKRADAKNVSLTDSGKSCNNGKVVVGTKVNAGVDYYDTQEPSANYYPAAPVAKKKLPDYKERFGAKCSYCKYGTESWTGGSVWARMNNYDCDVVAHDLYIFNGDDKQINCPFLLVK